MIPKDLLPANGLVDVFCLHTRLNKTALQQVLHENTTWITILRHPVNLYESLFNYYHLEHTLNMTLDQITNYSLRVGIYVFL